VRAFRVACILRADIHHDTLQALQRSSSDSFEKRNLPYVHKISAWPPNPENVLEFRLWRDLFQAKKNVYQNWFTYEGRWQNDVVFVEFIIAQNFAMFALAGPRAKAPRLRDRTPPSKSSIATPCHVW